mgnify:CR=1 FL=1
MSFYQWLFQITLFHVITEFRCIPFVKVKCNYQTSYHWKNLFIHQSLFLLTDCLNKQNTLIFSLQSRLAVNSVTAGDYGRPMRIAKFVGDLDSGFRLLNLKNDSLRKRFDGLKYDLKKVEEVVYDLSIRGLKPAEWSLSWPYE